MRIALRRCGTDALTEAQRELFWLERGKTGLGANG